MTPEELREWADSLNDEVSRLLLRSAADDIERLQMENAELVEGREDWEAASILETESACLAQAAAIADAIGRPLTKENYAVLRGAYCAEHVLQEVAYHVAAVVAALRGADSH